MNDPEKTLVHAFDLIARIAAGCRADQERIVSLEWRVRRLEGEPDPAAPEVPLVGGVPSEDG